MAHVVSHKAPLARRSSVLVHLASLLQLRTQRRALKDLDAHLLADIGVNEADAHKEADRPFWDAPAHWVS